MSAHEQIRHNVNFSNNNLAELSESFFGKKTPQTTEIFRLEKKLQQLSLCSHEKLNNKQSHAGALILSSDTLEQNKLTLIFQSKGIGVDNISTRQNLFDQFPKKQNYSVVIVSESYNCIGLNFLAMYFRSFKKRPLLIYLGNDLKTRYSTMGFDAHLHPPLYTKDLMNVLLKLKTPFNN